MGFVTTAVLIFAAILGYRLYRTVKSTMLLVKAASKIAHDTITLVQEGIKPLTTILALIQGIRQGFERFSKKFRKENNEGEKMDRKTLAGFGIVLLAGAVIGEAIALLYAPKSGKETREMLKSKAMETREGALEFADHVRDFATETADKVKAAGGKTDKEKSRRRALYYPYLLSSA